MYRKEYSALVVCLFVCIFVLPDTDRQMNAKINEKLQIPTDTI